MKRKFTPILGDLESLTQEQRAEYVLAACEHLSVPAELGLVGLRLMDSGGDGKRNLVLYVEKGATDIIRGNLGIDVESMTEVNGTGYVGWKTVGRDKTGRHEIAVGTVSIDGLKGLAVANAVMAAQTKSGRRMTLQFAGGGFLDITELGEKTTDIVNSAQSLAQIAAQPSTKPNSAPGKDVTETPQTTPPIISDVSNVSPQAINGTQDITQAASKRRGRPRRTISLDTPLSEAQSMPTIPAEPKPVEVTTVEPVKPALEITQVNAITTPPSAALTPVVQAVAVTPPVVPVEVPSDGGTPPTPDQKKAYRDRLSAYINVTLPAAGFLQSTKLGSRNDKMKLFIKEMYPKANTKVLSVSQWDNLFSFLDGKVQEIGAPGLVKFIDAQIGEEVSIA